MLLPVPSARVFAALGTAALVTAACRLGPPASTTPGALDIAPADLTAAPPPSRVQIINVELMPGDATITLRNAGSTTRDLSGWVLQSGTSTAQVPAGIQVAPGATITLHASTGTSSSHDVYLGRPAAELMDNLRPGGSIALLDTEGGLVMEFSVPGG